MLSRPEAIIFDWDNTLVDSLRYVDQARIAAFEEFKAYGSPEAQLMNSCASKGAFFSQFGEKEQEVIEFFLASYNELTKDGVTPLDKAAETLQLIETAGIPMVIVSNKLNTLLNKEIEALQWDKYFSKIIGSKDTPQDKPHPTPVYAALKAIGIAASNNVWLIGDSTLDVQCALSAPCYPILFGDKTEFDQTQVPGYDVHHVENHHALIALLLPII